MEKWLVVAGVGLLTFLMLFLRGNKLLVEREKLLEKLGKEDGTSVEHLAVVSYHGGYPPLPKPQKLNIAVSDQYMVLMNRNGEIGKINFNTWADIDKFTTRKNPDMKGKSIVLWGPMVGIFLRPKLRHFVVVNYTDVNDCDNNLLIELPNEEEMRKTFDRLSAAWNAYRTNGRSGQVN